MSLSWQKSHPEAERDSVLICAEMKGEAIAPAVRELIGRMTSDWLADGRSQAEAVLMIIDATNGHIMFTWDHLNGGGDFYEEGWPTYYLELKALWRASLKHETGARRFDRKAHFALWEEVARVLGEAEDAGVEEDYVYYEKFEWGSAQRLIV